MDGGEYFLCTIGEDCGRAGKKILHDAQTMSVFSGSLIFTKNSSEVKELKRDSLKTIQAYIPLTKSVLLP